MSTAHVGLAHHMVDGLDKLLVDRIAVTDPPKAIPFLHLLPERFEGLAAAVANGESENPWMLVVNDSPNPSLFFLDPTKVCNSSSSPMTGGFVSSVGIAGNALALFRTQLMTVLWQMPVQRSMLRNPWLSR